MIMKKISLLAVAFALVGLGAQAQGNAANTTQAVQQTTPQGQQNKQKITLEELPEAVKTAVTGGEYKEWTVGEVHKLQPAEAGAAAIYEVQLLNKEQEQPVVVRYDEAGNVVQG
ncbi:hypothetical protein SAMN04487941_2004 [Pontibacter akesuensis]|uniref:Peptidase propeptide and YPEB domain-containing protein n=2 Tax=Pontibacter akesuensis TaxID=388950 RepID=A0A1I7I8B1_9BACT|nr:hypothetical protein GCM10007389_18370 [Pontibacter akesuensis]SFU69188.1 hypothetical protein SAMN04487941_2004 [Pontibacter akesuensis]